MKKFIFAVGVMALAVALSFTASDQAFAQGANKVRAAGSTLEVFGPTAGPVTVLSTALKTSTNADLILQLTAECGMVFSDLDKLETDTDTNTTTGFACNAFVPVGFFGRRCVGFFEPVTGSSQSPGMSADSDMMMAQVEMWVEIDGVPVPVASTDNGRVLFCKLDESSTALQNALNVSTQLTTTESQFKATRTSNSFNWLAKNVGQGTHTVEVKALVQQASSGSFSKDTDSLTNFLGSTTGGSSTVPNAPSAQGVIGKRTLIIEPVSPQK